MAKIFYFQSHKMVYFSLGTSNVLIDGCLAPISLSKTIKKWYNNQYKPFHNLPDGLFSVSKTRFFEVMKWAVVNS